MKILAEMIIVAIYQFAVDSVSVEALKWKWHNFSNRYFFFIPGAALEKELIHVHPIALILLCVN